VRKGTVSKGTAIAIHGGAGVTRRDEPGEQHRAVLTRALEAGYELLKQGESSLDAVTAAVVVLEDSPLFNAGRGSCFNADGEIEMDASVMEGGRLRAGAVAAVRRIRNPVLAARLVMDKTRHVLLAGDGAERFAAKHGLDPEPAEYFRTERQLENWKRNLKNYHGTVGAVALDRAGNLAAATSTGGYTGKMPGRIGDSPLIGAGTYADNRACAVSGTGVGEAFIRAAVAHDIAARMRYRGVSLAAAARAALANVKRLGGDGGLVALDRRGNVAMPFNSEGMYRGAIDRRGRTTIAVF
jgi:beta-aspartyl-peptidase (threonine type)